MPKSGEEQRKSSSRKTELRKSTNKQKYKQKTDEEKMKKLEKRRLEKVKNKEAEKTEKKLENLKKGQDKINKMKMQKLLREQPKRKKNRAEKLRKKKEKKTKAPKKLSNKSTALEHLEIRHADEIEDENSDIEILSDEEDFTVGKISAFAQELEECGESEGEEEDDDVNVSSDVFEKPFMTVAECTPPTQKTSLVPSKLSWKSNKADKSLKSPIKKSHVVKKEPTSQSKMEQKIARKVQKLQEIRSYYPASEPISNKKLFLSQAELMQVRWNTGPTHPVYAGRHMVAERDRPKDRQQLHSWIERQSTEFESEADDFVFSLAVENFC